jgi:arsenite-transporting ATPase
MRVLLFTGKGGVGKTTAAAATAVRAAEAGCKTLVLSTDGAHSLGDAFGAQLTGDPVEVAPGLSALQVDSQRRFEQAWSDVQAWLVDWLQHSGVDPLEAEELTVLPGAEEVLALLAVRDELASGRWDLIVVDCAPTAETLRLLALPEALSWYMRRVFPTERRLLRTVRPLLNRATKAPLPGEVVFDGIERLHRELGDVHRVLTDPEVTSVRLVLTPEEVVVAEARRTLTQLQLHGYRVDAVVANRIFPTGSEDPWVAGWAASQAAQLAEVESSFAPLPILRAAYAGAEPVGVTSLGGWAATTYETSDVLELGGPVEQPVSVERTVDGFALTLLLPFVDKAQVDLARRGDELVVTVSGHRRVLALPSALRRCTVEGAALRHGRLVVRFVPDPDQWLRSASR